jgi:exodeoxyribonuclease VII small subunit
MENKSFESMLKQLETVVKKLEDKDIPLDEAVTSYQEGLLLAKACYDMLTKAEAVLVKANERDTHETGQ